MGRVLTDHISLSYAIEASPGVLPGSPVWHLLEPNSINTFGSTITTVARTPISKTRQRRKGTVTDLSSAVDFEHDLTRSVFRDFAEGFVFATATGQISGPISLSSYANALAATSSTSGYTYTSITGSAVPAGRLVFARGFTTAANNGLKVVGSSSTDSKIIVAGLTTESPSAAANAQVEVCGVRGASGDITVTSGGNLASTVLDFTTLGLTIGQFIWVGGSSAGNQFATAADTGFARVTAIAANLLSLDKTSAPFTTDSGTGKTIDIYFGQFIRNVPVDDGAYLERTFTFEGAYPNLDNPSGDKYEYPKGNECNQLQLQLPLAEKSKITFGFVGLDTVPPTSTRATNASTPVNPQGTTAFSTATDILRLRLYDSTTSMAVCFKTATLTLSNSVTPEKCLGTLGASYLNTGLFEVSLDGQALFTESTIIDAIRNNHTLTMDFQVKNGDGGIAFDLPSLTLSGGARSFPVHQSVLVSMKGDTFIDPVLGTSLSVSLFPTLP